MKILICPLNWGLGHATRCVPIIRQLLEESHEVVIASDGFPLEFLRQQFPELRFMNFPSYKITYSSGKNQVFAMLKSLPAILTGILREHSQLNKILKSEHFDQVISDNRFGLWSKHTHCIYITHQLMIKMPKGLKWMEPLVRIMHKSIIQRYNECHIPDFEGIKNLSGDLSHKYPLPQNAKFIGPLSRFKGVKIIPDKEFKVLCIVSGVEPQRSIFEHNLIEKYQNENFKTLIVCGQPQKETVEKNVGNVKLLSHLNDNKLGEYIVGSQNIIARSGYSTLMDLSTLNCLDKAEFIPTPGQTEQEYLCTLHTTKK